MKTLKTILISFLLLSSAMLFGQQYDSFLDRYQYNKNFLNEPTRPASEYPDIQGSPYLEREFAEGTVYMKDTSAMILMLRYNIYTDQFEYRLNDVNYVVGNPRNLNRIVLGESVFVYLPFIGKGGYFELLTFGKSTLVMRRTVEFKPSEGPKPIEKGLIKPARFSRNPDDFYLVLKGNQPVEIKNMKTVKGAFQDQQAKIDSYMKTEKISRATKDNLIKIVEFYNTL